jgi:hypothetical protein
VLLAGVTMAGAADDAKAPLSETSRQLDQLQRQPAAVAEGGDNSLRSALPALGTTLKGREALPSTDPGTGLKDRKLKTSRKNPNQNWLVDGYEKLDPKANHDKDAVLLPVAAAPADGSRDDKTDETSSTKIDIFSLYEADAKERASSDRPSEHSRSTADPLAPFLQSWLNKAPDHDLVLADASKPDGAPGGLPTFGAAPVPAADGASTALILDFGKSAGDAPSNPYLASLSLPSLEALTPASTPALAPMLPDFGTPPVPSKNNLGLPPDSLLPAGRVDGRKPPPSPADEDRKYFPQLNRF